jgi:hypothetical protein
LCPFNVPITAHDPRGMKQVEERKRRDSEMSRPQAPTMRPLNPEIIRFVESLAIADARRDHLAAAQTTAIDARTAKDPSSRVEDSTNDSRSHLRSILD